MNSKKIIIKIVVFIVLVLLTGFVSNCPNKSTTTLPAKQAFTELRVFHDAFENQKSNFQVIQAGRVIKLLHDDKSGLRHQKFLVQLESGQKLLVAHNIDIAPKIEELKEGEQISFCGEYEWNNKGGVVHWTHRDPRGKHPNGWLVYQGKKYE